MMVRMESSLTEAVELQRKLHLAHDSFLEAAKLRDHAVREAHRNGASAIRIAEALGITRQQVHKITVKGTVNVG